MLTHLILDFHRQLSCHTQDKSKWASSHSFVDKGQHQNTADGYRSLHGMGLSASFSLTKVEETQHRKLVGKRRLSLKVTVSSKSLKKPQNMIKMKKKFKSELIPKEYYTYTKKTRPLPGSPASLIIASLLIHFLHVLSYMLNPSFIYLKKKISEVLADFTINHFNCRITC